MARLHARALQPRSIHVQKFVFTFSTLFFFLIRIAQFSPVSHRKVIDCFYTPALSVGSFDQKCLRPYHFLFQDSRTVAVFNCARSLIRSCDADRLLLPVIVSASFYLPKMSRKLSDKRWMTCFLVRKKKRRAPYIEHNHSTPFFPFPPI